jgi:PIN domain nuclease of toxin-antitoxin system
VDLSRIIGHQFVARLCVTDHLSLRDVDLLAVMETDENPLHTAARIWASIDHPISP